MKASDFDLSRDIRFDFETGITSFRGSRLLIFAAGALGLLRNELRNQLGLDAARDFFLSFGYQNGYSDFMEMKASYTFDNEMELLASGPVIHTWEGIVQATRKDIRLDRMTGDFYFSGVWTNSWEAEQHLSHCPPDTQPVCWTLMGYASGWCTAFWGRPLIAIEPVCVGMGDDRCEWLIQSPERWGDEAAPYLAVYERFFERL